jgi:hypothetical protein
MNGTEHPFEEGNVFNISAGKPHILVLKTDFTSLVGMARYFVLEFENKTNLNIS